jgi:hypothetical protein
LSSGNFLFHGSAHTLAFLSRRSGNSPRTKDTAKFSVQSLDILLDRGSPFELVDGQVIYIHAANKYSKKRWKSRASKMFGCFDDKPTDA